MIRGTWIAAHALLIALGLRLFHLVLLGQHLGQPWLVASWLFGGLGLVLLLRHLASRIPFGDSVRLKALWSNVDRPALTFIAFFLVLLCLFHWGYIQVASDGREYYVQLRSLLMDWDLDFDNDTAIVGAYGRADIYPFGAPILWAPFFLLAHSWLALLNLFGGDFLRDGFAAPYQRAIGLGTLVYGFLGLVLIYKILRDYFSKSLATLTTISICCGSFLLWYLVVENSMVHGVSMFSTTLFLYIWYRTRGSRTLAQWALLGASAGLMALVRWQNIFFVVIPGTEAVWQYWRTLWTGSKSHLKNLLLRHSFFLGCGFVAFFPQLLFWKTVRGEWIDPPTISHGVHWFSLEVGSVLFSPNHGLFSWTPLLYFAVLGLPLFLRRDKFFGAMLIVGFLAQLYVNSVVLNWWGGAAFGARRFANCALIFAVGFASLLAWLKRRPLVAPVFVAASLVAVNAFFMLDIKRGRLPSEESVTFDRVMESVYSRLGNPFSFPKNAEIAWRYDATFALYDRLGSQTFNNLRLDVGEDGDDKFLVIGWSYPERGPGFTFRWAIGQESSIVTPLKAAAEYSLEFTCEPFVYPGAPLQVVEVLANGELVGRVALENSLHTYKVDIPATFIRENLNEFRFRYHHAASPISLGMSRDRRPLAVRFDRIYLIRRS